uniref:Uncharacterized protein n=1 Tax=Rhizophora mucronata TaxID=61149 RepID=A0A2P2M333_RHIMU
MEFEESAGSSQESDKPNSSKKVE